MRLFAVDAEVEMPGIIGQTVCDTLRPFDREAPWWLDEVVDHQCIEVGTGLEPVGIEVDELAAALVERVEVEGRASDRFIDCPCPSHSANESRFAGAEIAVKGEHSILWHQGRKITSDSLSGLSAFSHDTVLQLLY